MRSSVLAFTDDVVLPMGALEDAVRELGDGAVEHFDYQVMTQALTSSTMLLESSSVDAVVSISRTHEFPGDSLFGEVLRVLKPGGTIMVCKTLQSVSGEMEKAISAIEHKLILAGFLEAQAFRPKSETAQTFGVKAKKPSWKIGSSFALKKPAKGLVKVQLEDDADLIDEDSLLTEEDLKKPKIPVGDCEVGSTRKACKNCTCGRAEAEEKVKLGLTMDQINNPQSACGSCGLGDAFRCSTCPYKGLPPFKLGEKVSLTSNFLAADI